jgi:two-component system chemotaxis response regulator CheB
MPQKPISVLLVDDSPLALAVLQRMLASAPGIEVVGTATNGREALELIPRLQPALICTDYHMPHMDGLELIRQVMARFPRPILVISSAVGEATDADRVFALLEAGAVDVFPKPRGGPEADAIAAEQLIKKVTIVAGVWVLGRRPKAAAPLAAPAPLAAVSAPRQPPGLAPRPRAPQIVAIGASTGGPQALQTILAQLPAHFALPILCVQHISSGFLAGLVSWLGAHCRGKVVVARDGEIPRPGSVYFPQEDTHLVVDRNGQLQASDEPPLGGHRPSVTVTFRSVAEHYGDAAIGVLLTGMGRDGGEGMQAMAQAGALTIAQDEASCVIFGMPKDAVERGAARAVLPLDGIARALIDGANSSAPASGQRM